MNEFANKGVKKTSDILDRIEETLFPGEIEIEGTGYERNVFDRRLEKYLDQHFDEYIDEFGLVRELHFEIYESKYQDCLKDVNDLEDFQKDIEAELDSLSRRLDKIEEEF
ncbi:MAG: hypothetical protein KGY66_03835 [Candidatus Thermoplasmatota archaeon]|nr:hypothetical protein [Candidatus Thermoplasmatota archaeon]MBS3790028.1 hypothetical protein [Candidatus Thermoplasmatota archaeon]